MSEQLVIRTKTSKHFQNSKKHFFFAMMLCFNTVLTGPLKMLQCFAKYELNFPWKKKVPMHIKEKGVLFSNLMSIVCVCVCFFSQFFPYFLIFFFLLIFYLWIFHYPKCKFVYVHLSIPQTITWKIDWVVRIWLSVGEMKMLAVKHFKIGWERDGNVFVWLLLIWVVIVFFVIFMLSSHLLFF